MAVPDRRVAGTFLLTKTASSPDAVMVSANDPGLLEPLLEPAYHLIIAAGEASIDIAFIMSVSSGPVLNADA